MYNAQPKFDIATHYRIELGGRVDVDWLQNFDSSAVIRLDDPGQVGDTTVVNVHTDQSGIIGLLRRLHGLGITILQLQIVG